MAKLTYDRVQTTGATAVNASKLLVSAADTRTIQQALLEASAGTFGGDLNFEFLEVTSGQAAAEQLTLAIEPSSPTSTLVFVSGGTAQYYGTDYIVTGDVLSWAGLGLADIIVAGTKLILIYPYTTATPVGSGDITRVEYFSLGASEIAQKYVDLLTTPSNPLVVQMFVIGGSAQKKSTDWELITDGASDKRVSWDGYALESELVEGDELMIVYTLTTTNPDQAVNVQTNAFTGNLAGATEVQAALDIVDGLTLGGGGGTGILGSGAIMLVDPSHPAAADDGDVSTPFNTIQAAIDAATPAVSSTILIADGEYTESDITVKDNRIINLTALTSSKSPFLNPVSIIGNIVVGGDTTSFPLINVSGSLTMTGLKVSTPLLVPEPPVLIREPNTSLNYTNHLVIKDCSIIDSNSNYNIIAYGGAGLSSNSLEVYNSRLAGSSNSIQIYGGLSCTIENSTLLFCEVDFTSSGSFVVDRSEMIKLLIVSPNGSYAIKNSKLLNLGDSVVSCDNSTGTVDLEITGNYILCTNPNGNWIDKSTGDVDLLLLNNYFYNEADNIPSTISPKYEQGKEILLRHYVDIDALTTGEYNLYTVPIATKVVITKAMFRLTTATGLSGTLQCGIGVAAGADDILTSTSLTGFNTAGEIYKIETSGNYKLASSGDVIKLGIDTAFTGTTATLAVDLFGYLVV